MAPEIYQEEYNELADIYSFGMCILEMVSLEYPYSECANPAQIYKKVISGKKPASLYRIMDKEVREFVEKCLVTVSERLPAKELLKNPFLRSNDCGDDSRIVEYREPVAEFNPLCQPPLVLPHLFDQNLKLNECSENGWGYEIDELGYHNDPLSDYHGYSEDEICISFGISIKGKRTEDDGVFLRIRILDSEGQIRNISFPFDIEADTALTVAMEMVTELDISDQDVTKIAAMIDGEISLLVSDWKPGFSIEDPQNSESLNLCNCVDSSNVLKNSRTSNHVLRHSQSFNCTRVECGAAVHGRFEEITYQVEGSERCVTDGAPALSSQSESPQSTVVWPENETEDSVTSRKPNESRTEHSRKDHNVLSRVGSRNSSCSGNSVYHDCYDDSDNPTSGCCSPVCSSPSEELSDGYDTELRWLQPRHQAQLI